MLRRPHLLIWLLLVPGSAAPAMAEDSPLDVIPQTAVVVGHVKSLEQLAERVVAWSGDIPGDIGVASLASFCSGDALAATGLNKDTDLWVIWLVGASNEFEWAIIVQVDDLEKAKTGLRFVERTFEQPPIAYGKWHIFTNSDAISGRFQECKAGKSPAVGKSMDRRSRALFDKSAAAYYLNVRAIRPADPKDDIDAMKAQYLAEVDASFANNQDPFFGLNIASSSKPTMDRLRGGIHNLVDGFFHLIADVNDVAVGLSIDGDWFELEVSLSVPAPSPTAQFLKRHPASDMQPLGRLPAGAVVYYGLAGELGPLAQWFTQLQLGGIKDTVKPDAKATLAASAKAIEQRQTDGYFGSLSVPSNPANGPVATNLIVQTNAAEDVRAFNRQFIQLTVGSDPDESTIQPNAETLRSRAVDLLTIKMPVQASKPSGDASKNPGNEIKLLPDRWESRTATLPGMIVEASGGRHAMEALLAGLEAGAKGGPIAAAHSEWAGVRERLGAKANVIGMIDLPRAACAYIPFMMPFVDDPNSDDSRKYVQAVADFLKSVGPSYLSFSAAAEPDGLRLKLCLPREQFTNACRFLRVASEDLEWTFIEEFLPLSSVIVNGPPPELAPAEAPAAEPTDAPAAK